MKKIITTSFLCFFTYSSLFSQEIKNGEVYAYARKIVDTMASQSMHGRGYVNGGDSIAANYLKNEFSKIGLMPFGSDYYQRLSFAINTFPDTLNFSFMHAKETRHDKTASSFAGVDNSYFFKGIPGQNFLIDPSSGINVMDQFPIYVFDSLDASSKKNFKKFGKRVGNHAISSYVLIDDRNVKDKKKLEYFKQIKSRYYHFGGYIEIVNKLTWSQSMQFTKPKVQILADSFHSNSKAFIGQLVFNSKFKIHPSQNVIGYIQGSVYPDSFIVYSAHYDHLGHMGKDVYFPGANDNASGCAMLLNLANYYSKPENKPKYSIAFMAFCGEEVGLLGSKYYTENPLFPLKNIKFVFNMDIMGTGEEGITVVNGTIFKNEFDKLKEINTQNNFIKDVKIRGKAANSDHYFFSEKGVKAFFIYSMGGIKAYHDIYDRPETLPLNEFENMFKLITKFGESLQQ